MGGDYMVKMLDPYHNLSEKDLGIFETKNNIELTDNYKRFLIRWNGGTPYVGVFMISEEAGPTVMNYFYSICDQDIDLAVSMDSFYLILLEGFLTICYYYLVDIILFKF